LPPVNVWPPGVCFVLPGALAVLVIISFVMVTKASSTFVVALAEVSRKGMLKWAASSSPSSRET
jgi:hypothetical protein